MRVRAFMAVLGLVGTLLLNGCGGDTTNQTSSTPPTADATVNFVVSDSPPTNVTVLAFQIQITGAVLQPGSVSLLPRPVTVDLAQLVSDTGFLASTVIDSGTYTSLTLTYANPQVTILNNTAAPIVLAGQTCSPGAVCTFSPALNQASITISNGIFPLTVQANSTTGLNMDLSIPDLLQSDLSIAFANGNSVNVSLLPQPSSSTSQQAEVDDVFGTITSASGTQINMTTALGDSLVLTSSSSTKYNYPASVCSTPGASCLATGQLVTVNMSLLGDGAVDLNSISYVGSSGTPLMKGLVLNSDPGAATPYVQVLVQRTENESALLPGEIATVYLSSGTAYAVGAASYPAVSGGSFSSPGDLMSGQELVMSVGSNLVSGSSPSFNAGTVYLEPSQLIGRVVSVNSGTSSVAINSLSGLFTWTPPIVQQMEIQTDATTAFVGFSSASVSGLSAGQFVAAKGPLFNTTGGGDPTMSAIQLRERASGN
jgi:hypothetical protein